MRHSGIPLVLLSCCGVLAAQSPAQTASASAPSAAPAPEINQHDAPARFASRSNLVQVPVIVRDKQGHAVGNLTKDDFFLFDKGKPQIITKFVMEKAGTPYLSAVSGGESSSMPTATPFDEGSRSAPPIPERYIAYLIDDVHLDAADLLRLRQVTMDHISRSLDPVTRVAIATTSGMGSLDFTDDLVKIRAAMNALHPYTQSPVGSASCPNISLYVADLIVNKNDPNAVALALGDANACLGGNTMTGEQIRSLAIGALSVGESESKMSLYGVQAIVRRIAAMPGSRSIVMISGGFLVPEDDLRPQFMSLLDEAIHNNVTVNTLDARGVYTIIPGGDASTRSVASSNTSLRTLYDADDFRTRQDVLEEISSGTGGAFFHNDNGFAEGLDQLTKQPEFTYLLGFSPADLRYDGSYHSLKVQLKNPASLSLQARKGYYAPNRPNDPAEAAKEDIREAVFSRDEIQDIPISMRLQFFKSSENSARLSVISHVDLKTLHFVRDQDRSQDTLVIVAGLFDRNGNFVSGTQRTVEMNLRDQTLATLNANGINVPAYFEVTPGAYTVRVVVRDSQGQTMAARNGVVQIP